MNRIFIKVKFKKLTTAWKTSGDSTEFAFHLGYQGFEPARWARKAFAKSKWHYAWMSGFYGGAILPILERSQ